MTQRAQARLAATVLVARDGEGGPEIFMVRRHHKNKFMANATVFVGGRVDDADADASLWGERSGMSPQQAAERIGVAGVEQARAIYTAAIRETFEESGVLLAFDAAGDLVGPEGLAALRDQLNADEVPHFGALLGDARFAAFSELRYLARWVTPEIEPRRYDTYFFVCRMPPEQTASYDQRETTAGDWYRPEELLAANARKEVLLAPPTLSVLEDLAGSRDVAELLGRASDAPTAPVMPRPWMSASAKALTLLMPDDHRYNDPNSSSGREHYAVLQDGYWQRIRNG